MLPAVHLPAIARPRGSVPASAALATALAFGACQAKQPDPGGGGGGDVVDAGGAFADTVMTYTEGGEPVSCAAELPICGETAATCGPLEVLGPPDAVTYPLAPGAVIELALLCSQILERGEEGSADMKLWATVPAGGHAVVEVSFDGTEWRALDDVETSDPELDLDRVQLTVIRFVRIANQGATSIDLDAVGAFDG